MVDFDFFQGEFLAGCDEVGRGPLAGPVTAASFYIPYKFDDPRTEYIFKRLSELNVTDSKKLTHRKRQKILQDLEVDCSRIEANSKIELPFTKDCVGYFSIVEKSPSFIDEVNILNASLVAMNESFINCYESHKSGVLLIDGNKTLKNLPTPVEGIPLVKGDSRSLTIGLASIIAKEHRDQKMCVLDGLFPGYGLARHAGYPTQVHLAAIAELGPTEIHRKSFKGVREHL